MDVTITARPMFCIGLDRETALVLKRLSDLHYDSECRGLNREGGYLWNVIDIMDLMKSEREPRTLTWRQVDTTLKLLETAGWPGALGELRQFEIAARLNIALRKMMNTASEVTSKIDIKLEFPL